MRELSLHILDVVENSLAAGATHITLLIEENLSEDRLTITVTDNGRGMDAETLKQATDPFFTTRTTRHVGLGLPLLKAAAERCNGQLVLESAPGQGTRVVAHFQHSHIDRAPLGDMAVTVLTILLSERLVNLHYIHRVDGKMFEVNTEELRKILEDVPFSHPLVRNWLYAYLAEGESSLREGHNSDNKSGGG